jgi:hypothetical protein
MTDGCAGVYDRFRFGCRSAQDVTKLRVLGLPPSLASEAAMGIGW